MSTLKKVLKKVLTPEKQEELKIKAIAEGLVKTTGMSREQAMITAEQQVRGKTTYTGPIQTASMFDQINWTYVAIGGVALVAVLYLFPGITGGGSGKRRR